MLSIADILTAMVVDVSELLDGARKRGDLIMFEGAQGTLLDIDHGTYPYVTSSNTTAGGVATSSGIGPRYVDYVLGIVKAYSTRVGAGPFPTELFDETGEYLCKQGNEFGATTGRRRRTGWLDAVAVRRAVQINSLSGFCLTKLDVLDGLKEVKICVGYRMPDGREVDTTPLAAEGWEGIEPIYETMPGWSRNHLWRERAQQAASGCAELHQAHRRSDRRTGRYHLYRPGSQRNHDPARPVRRIIRLCGIKQTGRVPVCFILTPSDCGFTSKILS